MAGRPTTWRDILSELAAQIGYYTPWFDGDGLCRIGPATDLSTATTDISYSTAADGVLLSPLKTGKDYARLANRVMVASTAPGVLTPLFAIADANTVYPGHPLSEAMIGFYLDQIAENAVSASMADLQAQADRTLDSSLSLYQTATLETMIMPVHECFDVVGVQVTDDAEFDVEQRFHEGNWSVDAVTLTMRHELRRVSDA